MEKFMADTNYQILQTAYAALEFQFDEETAPPEVCGLIFQIRDLLDDACRIYEDSEFEADNSD